MKQNPIQIASRVLCLACVCLLAAGTTTHAATFTWGTTTTPSSWASQGNWSTGTLPTTTGDTADFSQLDITAATTVTLDGNQSVNQMIFGDTATNTAFGWVVSAGTPTTSTLAVGGVNPMITVNKLGGASIANITAPILATNLTVVGPGILNMGTFSSVINGLIITNGATFEFGSGASYNWNTLTFIGNGTVSSGMSSSYTPSFNVLTNLPGVSSTFNFGSRCVIGVNAATPPNNIAGTVTINIGALVGGSPTSRNYLQGVWENASGAPCTINIVGTSTTSWLQCYFNGGSFNSLLTNATFNFYSSNPGVNKITCGPHNASGGNGFNMGALTGSSDATLSSDNTGLGTTYIVGALNTSTTFAGTFQGNAGLTKVGTGTLTLPNNSTVGLNAANAVNVNAGKLVGVTGGSFIAPSFNVANGATNGVQVASTGGQWVTTNLVYATGTNYLEFNFGTTVASTTIAPLLTTNLTINSVSNVISVLGGVWTPGTYPLVKYSGTLAGSGGFAAIGLGALPLRVVATLNNNTANHSIDLVVSAVNEPLKWAASSGTWDIGSSGNWKDAAANVTTYQEQLNLGDQVVLEDNVSGASPITITLNSTVTPSAFNVTNSSKNYTLSGNGNIQGAIALNKSGSGTLTVTTTNTFTGAVNLNGGTLVFSSLTNNLGAGSALNFNGGELEYASGNTDDISVRTVTISAGGAAIDTAGNNVSFAKRIGNNGTGSLTKTGNGSLTLNTNSTYTGATFVNQGTLALGASASLSNSPALVVGNGAALDASLPGGLTLNGLNGQILAGSGTVTGAVITVGGAKLSPATNGVVGSLTLANDLTLNGGTFYFDVGSSSHDLIIVGGYLNLNATVSGTMQINALSLLPINSTNTLLQYPPGQLTGGGVSTLSLAVSGVAQSGRLLQLDNSVDGQINLVVLAAPAHNLTWLGDGSANAWDTSSPNWTGVTNTYSDGDNANFTDLGSPNFTVNISPSAVTPNSVAFNATNNYTITGAKITGPATVTKSNTNTVVLANTGNDYGATVINAGELQIGDGVTAGTSIGQGNVTDNATLIFNQPDNSQVPGNISGTGTLTKQGAGTLTLLGSNSYGATTNDTGTLQVGNGGLFGTLGSGPVALLNNANLTINRSGTFALNNGISGSGQLTLAGPALVTLGGANSYLNNTVIADGILQLTGPAVIPSGGATTGWVVLDGGASSAGTLDLNGHNQAVNTLSGVANTVLGQIVNNGGSGLNTLTIGTTLANTTYAGLIENNNNAGTGQIGLNIVGDGSLTYGLTLAGANSYTGPVLIDGAKVILGGSQTGVAQSAIGTGAVTLTNGGSLQMNGYGNGSSTGWGNFGNTILVPAGTTGNLLTMGRGSYSSSLIVHGTLNLTTSYVRSQPTGDWSASDGTINILAGLNGGLVYLNNSGNINFGTALLNLGAGVVLANAADTGTAGNTITIGDLAGSGTIEDTTAVAAGRVTTYVIGGHNSNPTFSGTIKNANRITAITKVGTGAWTLAGTDTYTGATTISSGSVIVGSSSFMAASSPINIAAGALLDVSAYGGLTLSGGQTWTGSGVVTGAVSMVDSDILTPGSSTVAGTLSFSNSLALGSGTGGYAVTNNFALSGDPTGISRANSQVIVAGDLTLTGTNVVIINPLNAILGAGTYTLFKYSGNLNNEGGVVPVGTVLANNFMAGGTFPVTSDVTLTFSNANKAVVMIVTPNGNNLTWTGGAATNRWDLNVSSNWVTAGLLTNFFNYDNVTFDNSSSNQTVNLTGTLAPGTITVNSDSNYVFASTGKISGTTGLTKSGAGTLTISDTGGNDFTGTVTINAGVLKAGVATALGATNGATVITNTGALDIGGQTLANEPVVVSGNGGGGGAIQNSGAVSLSALQFVTLAGDATFGGTNRWDIRTNAVGAYLQGNGYNLTKIGMNDTYLVNVGSANLGNVQIQQGRIGLQNNTTLGSGGTLTLWPGAGIDLWDTTVTNTKAVSMTNATISSTSSANTYGGAINLNGTGTFIATTPLQLNGIVGGTGGLLANGAGVLTLNRAETYSGSTTISNGVLALTASASLASATLDVASAGAVLDVTAQPAGNLTLASGQTLKGVGTVRGSVSVPASGTLSPGESTTSIFGRGTLTVTNAVTLAGNTTFGINKTNAQTSDRIVCAAVNYGGTLTLNNLGPALAVNDFFQLFSVSGARTGAFTTIAGSPGPGLAWYTGNLTIDGTIAVIAGGVTPVPINYSLNGNQLTLNWSGTGWHLLAQTNSASVGLSTNWVDSGITTSPYTITVDPQKGAVFFRLSQ